MNSFAKCAAVLLLAACSNAPLGSDLPPADFGNATMTNGMVQSGELNVTMALSTRFAREVPSTINFAFNSATLDTEAQAVLRSQAQWIRQFPELRFRVYGHTDLVGSDAYNKRLGLRRAQAVVAFFATQGISPSRLEAMVSHGKTQPLVITAAPERQNRRTVTEVSGFVKRHPTVMNGKYAEVIFRDFVASAAQMPTGSRAASTGQ